MRRFVTLGAVVALALGSLGACGDDDGDTEPDAGETTTTTASATTTTAASATTTSVAATLECDMVAFTPNSEDAASDIKATGLSCDEAEAFVRVAGRRTSSGGPQQVNVEGYRCVLVRSEQDPLPRAFYECTNGPRKVTFVRT